MSFSSGRVSFCRFKVDGDAPAAVDETVLGTLKDHAFHEAAIGVPDVVEAGFITGTHLFDTQFTYEANAFGDPPGSLLLCALRLDTHQVPAEVSHAYKQIETQAAAKLNPSGFASKAQKKDAADVADRRLHDEIAAGKYRRSKVVPVLWDLAGRQLFLGATSNAAVEQIASQMGEAFNVDLEMLTSGVAASQFFSGNRRDFEDLQPSPFTAPPKDARAATEEAGEGKALDVAIPTTPWIAAASNTRDFLGNEWLIWLWWLVENEGGVVTVPDRAGGKKTGRQSRIALVIDRSLDMDCAWDVTGRQSLRGGRPTLLPEAGEALAEGKWPRKMGLILADADDETQWELSLQGDRLAVSGAAMPKVEEATSPREITDARLQSTVRLAGVLDGLFHAFLAERTGKGWASRREVIREWIKARVKRGRRAGS